MKEKSSAAVIFLVAVIIFILVAGFILFREKQNLVNSLDTLQGQLTVMESQNRSLLADLEEERRAIQQLSQDKAALEQTVKAQEEKLFRLSEMQDTIDALNSRITTLTNDTQSLREEGISLRLQLEESARENADLKQRQGSIAGLNKAIRELKIKMRTLRRRPKGKVQLENKAGDAAVRLPKLKVEFRPKKEMQIKERIKDSVIDGNSGFIIREGKYTYPSKIRIEVSPADN